MLPWKYHYLLKAGPILCNARRRTLPELNVWIRRCQLLSLEVCMNTQPHAMSWHYRPCTVPYWRDISGCVVDVKTDCEAVKSTLSLAAHFVALAVTWRVSLTYMSEATWQPGRVLGEPWSTSIWLKPETTEAFNFESEGKVTMLERYETGHCCYNNCYYRRHCCCCFGSSTLKQI